MATLQACEPTIQIYPTSREDRDLIENAFLMAQAAHVRPESETEIDHPDAVARLLSEQEFDETTQGRRRCRPAAVPISATLWVTA